MDVDRQAREALREKAKLPPSGAWVYSRYSGTELGPDWRAFDVETLGQPEERVEGRLAGWRKGPAELSAPLQPGWSGVVLLRFRLVRHTKSGVEIGAHWRRERTRPLVIETWDGPRCAADSSRGKGYVDRATALLKHRAWQGLRRPTRIVVVQRGRLRMEVDPASPYRPTIEGYLALKVLHPLWKWIDHAKQLNCEESTLKNYWRHWEAEQRKRRRPRRRTD